MRTSPRNPEVRQQILDDFHAHDYVLVGKYLRIDTDNYWFAPAAAMKAHTPPAD